MSIQAEMIIKIVLAILLGGLIGAERKARDKTAGFRTLILICLGATLFTMLSSILAGGTSSVAIAANIVTGIGFLGAGAILRDGNRISGLTTASSIWLSAAIGMALGAGEYFLAITVTLAGLIVLWFFPFIEVRIDNLVHTRTYEVICHPEKQVREQLESRFAEFGLKVKSSKRAKIESRIKYTWQLVGKPIAHEEWIDAIIKNADVLEFSY